MKEGREGRDDRGGAVVSLAGPGLAGSTLVSPVSWALVSLSPSISLFLSVGPRLLWMKFQQGYEGMVHGV